MTQTSLEHGRAVYILDLVLQGAAALALGLFLLLAGPRGHALRLVTLVVAGLAGWTAIEYVTHRFLFHGVQPFRRWHAEHHRRPTALIGTPTIVSAVSIGGLVFLPAMLLTDMWVSCSLTLGVLIGYLAYEITHHATHHWRCHNAWFRRRQHLHALHHRAAHAGNYGVTSAFWDHVFGTSNEGP